MTCWAGIFVCNMSRSGPPSACLPGLIITWQARGVIAEGVRLPGIVMRARLISK